MLISVFFSVDGIVSFLKKQAGPASVELKSEADLAKYTGDHDASVVGELLIYSDLFWSLPPPLAAAVEVAVVHVVKPEIFAETLMHAGSSLIAMLAEDQLRIL